MHPRKATNAATGLQIKRITTRHPLPTEVVRLELSRVYCSIKILCGIAARDGHWSRQEKHQSSRSFRPANDIFYVHVDASLIPPPKQRSDRTARRGNNIQRLNQHSPTMEQFVRVFQNETCSVLRIANCTSRRQFGTHGASIHNTHIFVNTCPPLSLGRIGAGRVAAPLMLPLPLLWRVKARQRWLQRWQQAGQRRRGECGRNRR